MFTGLVEEVATLDSILRKNQSAELRLRAHRVLEGIQVGDSIAVNGVCLTVVNFSSTGFSVDAVPETLRRTNLGELKPGSSVNLERALQANQRLGGHIVSGHVDGVGVVSQVVPEGNAKVLTISVEPELSRYIASKGSICVNGISLTVMDVTDASFRVSIIPHTSVVTTLAEIKIGDRLNLECDVLAKYVERLLQFPTKGGNSAQVPGQASAGVNLELLQKSGFL